MTTSRKGKAKEINPIQEFEDDNSLTISRIYKSLSLGYNMYNSSELSETSKNIVCAQARMTFWAVFYSGKDFTKLSNNDLVNTAIEYLKNNKGIKNPKYLYSRGGRTPKSREEFRDLLYDIVTELRFQYPIYIQKVFDKVNSIQRTNRNYSDSDSDDSDIDY